MWYLFSKTVLVLAVILLVPTGLVLASQNAVPGDAAYPVKRQLENIITAIASTHPFTQAFFKTELTKRRFKEAVALIKKGSEIEASVSLSEMLVQTEAAVSAVNQVSDVNTQKQLSDNLSKQIEEYKNDLQAIAVQQNQVMVDPLPVLPSPTLTVAPATPTVIVTPVSQQPTIWPTSFPTTTPQIDTPVLTIVPTVMMPSPTAMPTSLPSPTPGISTPPPGLSCDVKDLQKCVDGLEDLRKKLQVQADKVDKSSTKKEKDRDKGQEKQEKEQKKR